MTAATEVLSDAVGRGTLAARTAASIAGRLYWATDTSTLYRDNGASWDTLFSAASALTVEEVDASPTDSAVTKIVFPNGTLSISSHVATYTPASALTIKEEDASPSGTPSSLVFPNGTLTDDGAGGYHVRQVPTSFIGCRVYNSTDFSLSTAAETAVTFDSERFDSDNFHSVSSNTERLVVPAGMAGKYLIGATIRVTTTPGDPCYVKIDVNGSTTIGLAQVENNGNIPAVTLSTVWDLAAGDYLRLVVYAQIASKKALALSAYTTEFWAVKLDGGKVGSGVGASVYNSTTQSIGNNSETPLTFDTEITDTDGFHSTSVNTSRMTIPAGMAGRYLCTATVPWAANATGRRQVSFRVNGSTYYGLDMRPAVTGGNNTSHMVSAVIDLVAGDYVEVTGTQDSGGSLNIDHSGSILQARFEIARLDTVPGDYQTNWQANFNLLNGSHGNTNWSTVNLDTAELYGGDLESSGAQNAEIWWYDSFSAGTWTFRLLHFTGNNRGIYTLRVDDVDVGTIDGYSSGATKNVFSSITGIVLSPGRHKISLKMATKNGSSSNYFGTAQNLYAMRTA